MPASDMIFMVLPVLLGAVVTTVLDGCLGGWLVSALVLLCGMLGLLLLLSRRWPQLTLAVLNHFSQWVLAPVLLVLQMVPHQDALHIVLLFIGWSEGSGRGFVLEVPAMLRQGMFVWVLLLSRHCHHSVVMKAFTFVLWFSGVRCLLTFLAMVLSPKSETFPLSPRSPAFLRGLAKVTMAVVSMCDCAGCLGAWPLLGLLVFSLCSDTDLLHYFKACVRNVQLDCLEGFEGELMQGCLVATDLLVSVLVLCSLLVEGHSVLAALLTVINALVAVMDMYVLVKLQVLPELCRLRGLQRATRVELKGYDDVCAVCLSAMGSARMAPCRRHLFHGKCLRPVLAANPHCPLCKTDLLPSGGGPER